MEFKTHLGAKFDFIKWNLYDYDVKANFTHVNYKGVAVISIIKNFHCLRSSYTYLVKTTCGASNYYIIFLNFSIISN